MSVTWAPAAWLNAAIRRGHVVHEGILCIWEGYSAGSDDYGFTVARQAAGVLVEGRYGLTAPEAKAHIQSLRTSDGVMAAIVREHIAHVTSGSTP